MTLTYKNITITTGQSSYSDASFFNAKILCLTVDGVCFYRTTSTTPGNGEFYFSGITITLPVSPDYNQVFKMNVIYKY